MTTAGPPQLGMRLQLFPSAPEQTVRAAPRTRASRSAADVEFTINGRFFTQPVTGVQRYAREVCRELDQLLASRGAKALLCTPATDGLPSAQAFEFDASSPIAGHLWEQLWFPTRIRGPALSLGNLAPVAVRQQLVCIHDMNVFLVPDSYTTAFRGIYRILLPMIARRSEMIATVSEYSARQISKHLGIPLGRILIMPNGHEHALRWNAARSDLFARHPQRRPFVLVVGSRARHKNIDVVLGLADRLEQLGIDIWVAGPALAAFSAIDRAAASNVKPLGFVSDDDLAALYEQALCLAFPSLTEGFGIPLVEAMAHGCPIITSNCASMPDVCGPAALYADPGAADQWFTRISELHGSPLLRTELQEAGRERVTAFSWRNTAQLYDDALRALQ